MRTTSRSAAAILALALLAARLAAQAGGPAFPAAAPVAGLLCPERLRQGDPLLAWVLAEASFAGAEARLAAAGEGRIIAAAAAFAGPELASPPRVGAAAAFRAYGFLMAIPFDLPPGDYLVLVEGAAALSARLSVEARTFPSEDIALDAANTRLRSEPSPRKEAEARKLAELLARADPAAVFLDGSAFMLPLVPRRRSAGFGDRRRYLYQGGGAETSLHAGLDLAVATGAEVSACAPGRVVMAADRAVTGLTVVVEHLPGLYSLYMHLSTLFVAVGEGVERGTRLGLSGSTGLSTGPHLHWELRARGQAVDPEYWLSRPLLDKDRAAAIIARLIEGR